MTDDQAEKLVGILIGFTTGWNDDSVIAYVHRMRDLRDADAAGAAVMRIVDTWTAASRPTWAVMRTAYDDELRRRSLTVAALPAGVLPVPPTRGRKIAADAYVTECRKVGREPDHRRVQRILGAIGA